MARIPRASLVAIVLLLTACRLGTARREAIFRYAASAILSVAATDEPAVADSRAVAPVREVKSADDEVKPADAAPRTEVVEACASIPVHPVAIAPAELRPAVTPLAIERRIVLARTRAVDMRNTLDVDREACREAARIRAEQILREIRAFHVMTEPKGNTCRFDVADPQPSPSSSLEIEAAVTIGG